MERIVPRDEAAALAALKVHARATYSIAANPSSSAANAASSALSNAAVSVPAGGTGAAAADTAILISSQGLARAPLGESAPGGGSGGSGAMGGGAFAPGARAPGPPPISQPSLAPGADFASAVQQVSSHPGGAESALKAAGATPSSPPGTATHAAGAPSAQIAAQIGIAVRLSAKHISLQLKPASLGEVKIDLNIAPDGQVRATVLAERQDTLDLLQRDARGLERALQDAGLKSDSGSLQFGLRGEGREQPSHGGGDAYRAQAAPVFRDAVDELPPAWAASATGGGAERALDIRV